MAYRMKETADDRAVRDRLWDAERGQIEHWARRYNEEHVPGESYSDGQKCVCAAAKAKGYKVGWVRSCARDLRIEPDAMPSLSDIRAKMGI